MPFLGRVQLKRWAGHRYMFREFIYLWAGSLLATLTGRRTSRRLTEREIARFKVDCSAVRRWCRDAFASLHCLFQRSPDSGPQTWLAVCLLLWSAALAVSAFRDGRLTFRIRLQRVCIGRSCVDGVFFAACRTTYGWRVLLCGCALNKRNVSDKQ